MLDDRVCVLSPYYGRWPGNFSMFLKSCQANPTIDFILITDLPQPDHYPRNVRFVPMTLAEVSKLAAKRLAITLKLNSAYKLCDLKPTYGLVFAEFLEGYDFWVPGDIDVIYGDIRKFLAPELLGANDIISTRRDFVSGAFTVFRNDNIVNNLFRDEPAHVDIFQTEANLAFDETLWQGAQYWDDKYPDRAAEPKPCMTNIVRQAAKAQRIRAHFHSVLKELIRINDFVTVEPGRVYDRHREYLLYHLYSEKKRSVFKYPNWDSIPSKYFIRQTGFYRENEHRGLKLVIKSFNRRLVGPLRKRNAA